jgi:hypothetical protein
MSYLEELIAAVRNGERKIAETVYDGDRVCVTFLDGARIDVSGRQAQQLLRAADASGSALDAILNALDE